MTWPTVCLTGHRPQHFADLPADTVPWIRAELARAVAMLRDGHGLTEGVSGMAVGSDLWWADALTAAGVALWAHVPFPQQPDPWTPGQQAEWQRLLGLAARTTVYGDRYNVRLLHARNDGMLGASSAVVAVWRPSKRTGGTASALRKAVQARMPVYLIDPDRRRVGWPDPLALAQALRVPVRKAA